jgi:hypothetical protein
MINVLYTLNNLNEWTCPWLSLRRFNITWSSSVLLMGHWVVYLTSLFSINLSVYGKTYLSQLWQQRCLTYLVNISYLFYPTIDIKKNSKDIRTNALPNKQWPKTLYEIIYDMRIKHMHSKRFEWRLCHYGIWDLQK